MRIALLGATGRTGAHVLDRALDAGHEVTALVRDPARLARRDGVEVVVGDARDRDALARLVAGADVVVSALGPVAKDPTLHQETARTLVEVMTAAGVRRFVGISGAGVDVPGDRKSRRDRLISALIQRVGGAVVADKPAELAVWVSSGLDWTLVRPPRLVDGPATGRVEHDAHRSPRRTRITRADLARFLVDQVTDSRYLGAAPLVAEG
ncbi:NAD(P)H-binding protein [Actinotalea sp. AC32]|nr:NAD(P)H-binding protein [Actinotalea sp. AC32]